MLATLEQICSFWVKFYLVVNKLTICRNKIDDKFSVGLFNQNSELELKSKRNNSIQSRSVVTQVMFFNCQWGALHRMS